MKVENLNNVLSIKNEIDFLQHELNSITNDVYINHNSANGLLKSKVVGLSDIKEFKEDCDALIKKYKSYIQNKIDVNLKELENL